MRSVAAGSDGSGGEMLLQCNGGKIKHGNLCWNSVSGERLYVFLPERRGSQSGIAGMAACDRFAGRLFLSSTD